MVKIKQKFFRIILVAFALAGFIFFAVFVTMQFGWLNVKGSVSERNSYFNINKNMNLKDRADDNLNIVCQLNVLDKYAPATVIDIYKTINKGAGEELIYKMIQMASLRYHDDYFFNKDINNCRNANYNKTNLNTYGTAYGWADTDQWNLMKEVFTRDQDVINRAAKDAGISPRLILSGVIGEQFRFFSNSRDTFKSYFEPLKILASMSKFSFGIAGLKTQTVVSIENNLKNTTSPFYLGPNMEHIADYGDGVDPESERMTRITNSKDPYYSYLYVGLYMKEIISQWQNAGYDVSTHPEILATLYNLGFNYSVPKENPEIGGAVININNHDYTFGDIAYEFYYSGELSDVFPLGVQ